MKVNIHKKKILSLATAGVILVTGTGIILDKSNIPEDKLGMLILDVKGNYHLQVKQYCKNTRKRKWFNYNRLKWKN